MFWCYGLLSFLLLGDTYGIPITAIKQTATVAQVFSPENTQTIDSVFKIPVATLEAVGSLVKSTAEQRQQNAEIIQKNRQERRDRLVARKEQKWKRKEEILNQRFTQQQVNRVVRHHKDPLGLDALSDFLVGHHGLLSGHYSGLLDPLGLGGGHRHRKGHHGLHGGHGSHVQNILGNRPQNTYEVHEDVNEDTTFSWHGLTAGFGSFFNTRPPNTNIKIENKVAPKEKKEKTSKYSSDDVDLYNKVAKMKNKPEREDNGPPLENKIAPRSGKIKFV
ncbi:hypothetical protein EAI_13400 [Harpegnathos saltator]|uniref:Uncharacterized protein n=1 Tax=Harpegnathos saltator TaxID=610380 RepID=E2B958_HARSA|nr:hypothetical protein EAI_13400 [Harpegnathos saltator]